MGTLTPDQLAAPGTEHAHQTAFFCACASPQLYLTDLPQPLWSLLRLLYAIPSGGARDVVTAGRLKAEGVRPGVPDVHFPVARMGYHSLYMEFKKPERQASPTLGLSPVQTEFKRLLEGQGHCVAVVFGYQHALLVLRWYLT